MRVGRQGRRLDIVLRRHLPQDAVLVLVGMQVAEQHMHREQLLKTSRKAAGNRMGLQSNKLHLLARGSDAVITAGHRRQPSYR